MQLQSFRLISSHSLQSTLEVIVCNDANNANQTAFFPQHTSLDGFSTKLAGRQNLPRCRNSLSSSVDEQPHVGSYRLLKTIGKGNFAKVKLAKHVLTGREVRVMRE